MEHHVSGVIRALLAVASAMFTQRTGAGSTEARRAGANGAWIEARRAGAEAWSAGVEARIEGQECGGSGTRRCGIVFL